MINKQKKALDFVKYINEKVITIIYNRIIQYVLYLQYDINRKKYFSKKI